MRELLIKQWVVNEEQENKRLDMLMTRLFEGSSRTQIQSYIVNGNVTLNENKTKSNYRVQAGDKIRLEIPENEESQFSPENISLDIRYEDDDLLVINKPRGMVVHPGAGNTNATLVNALLAYCPNELSGIGGVTRPGIVHRIDKDTSGLLVVAKNDFTHRALSEQLADHKISRIYLALVNGVIPNDKGRIKAPIGRDTKDRKRMTVKSKNSKEAITHFKVLKRFAKETLLECSLETGRTHQIRVHFKFIGFPLVEDPIYGHKKNMYNINGQALHAHELTFTHPRTSEEVTVEAELPKDFTELLNSLS